MRVPATLGVWEGTWAVPVIPGLVMTVLKVKEAVVSMPALTLTLTTVEMDPASMRM